MKIHQSTDAAAAAGEQPDTSSLILEGAERVFREYGYGKTTVADIARDIGMSPANIYRFFPSKAALRQAIAERIVKEVEGLMLQIATRPISAEERLRIFVIEHHQQTVRTMLVERKVHELVAIALDEQWPVIERHLDNMTKIMEMIIRDGIADGEFIKVDPVIAARCLTATMATVCHPSLIAQSLDKPNRASPGDLIDFALKALKP